MRECKVRLLLDGIIQAAVTLAEHHRLSMYEEFWRTNWISETEKTTGKIYNHGLKFLVIT
jgi:hypothetical protein